MGLSSIYDPKINRKVFVLKGGESYANTTDTVVKVVPFDETIANARVGLEISVYRMYGKPSSVVVYNNDEVIKVIPWEETMSSSVISGDNDLSWDSDKKAVIWGTSSNDKGLYLDYETDYNIYARFVGNNFCNESTSKHQLLNIAVPDTFDVTLALDYGEHSSTFNKSESVTYYATLTDSEDNPLASKDVKVYLDDTYVTTKTTDTDGEFSHTPTTTTGLHTIKLVFEGDSTHYHKTSTLTFSKGYKITMDTPYTWVDNIGYLKGTVTDYYDNPITSLGMHCELSLDGAILTSNTDSNGRFTLSSASTNNNADETLTVYDDYDDSTSVTIQNVHLTTTLSSDRLVVTRGTSANLSINLTATDIYTTETTTVQALPVQVWYWNDLAKEILMTGNSAEYVYEGTTYGDNIINLAHLGVDMDADITIYDCISYGIVNDATSNLYCKCPLGYWSRKSSGYSLSNDTSSDARAYAFSEDFDTSKGWTFEFDIISMRGIGEFRVGTSKDTKSGHNTQVITVSAGDTVKIRKTSSQVKIYVNGTNVLTYTSFINPYPFIQINGSGDKELLIDNVKWYY